MRWSKLKKTVETEFADCIKSRIHLFSTCYGNCSCGRGWFTVDGIEVANFCTRAYFNKQLDHCSANPAKSYAKMKADYGEFSRQDMYEACWEFIHTNVHDSLKSPNPLVQSLALLSGRVGKNKLKTLDTAGWHELPKFFLEFRKQAEELKRPAN